MSPPEELEAVAGGTEAEAVARIVEEARMGLPASVSREGVYTVVTPAGWQREFFTLEPSFSQPERSSGLVCVHNAASFAAAVGQRQVGPLFPVVYADEGTLDLVAVLNDDHGEVPGWRDYRVRLTLRRTPEWEAWRNLDKATCNGAFLNQEAFAEFVEDHLGEIVAPSAADMLEMAQTFHATTSSKFRQGARLRDGRRQFVFEEDVDAKAGETGSLEIPGTVRIKVRLFVGGTPVETTARLRWRLREAKLTFGFKLDAPDELERTCWRQEIVAGVEEALSLAAIAGVAPPPAEPRRPAHSITP